MTTTNTFSNTRQQAGAFALSLALTVGMLASVNMLATQPAHDALMAAAASAPQAAAAAAPRT